MKARRFNTKAMKVSTTQVQEMYQRLKSGELTQGEAARIYGLGVIQVGRIARGESRAQETGALNDPVPNFNAQIDPGAIEASAARLKTLLEASSKAPSLYSDPPPADDCEPSGAGMDKLRALAQPTIEQEKVSDELDKLDD